MARRPRSAARRQPHLPSVPAVADTLETLVRTRLPRVADQPAGGGLPAPRGGAPTQAPTAAPRADTAALDTTDASHDAMFRPGGLLRPKRDAGGIDYSCGCMDYGYRRAKEPWEATDGGVRGLRELAAVRPTAAIDCLPLFVDAATRHHYAAAPSLRTTAWDALPAIADGVTTRAFKRACLDALLDPLFACLAGDHALCRAAAGRAVGALRDRIGPRVFAGRLDDTQRRLLDSSPDVPPPAGVFVAGGEAAAAMPGDGRAPWAATLPPVAGPALGAAGRPEAYAPGGFPLRVPAPPPRQE